MRTKNEVYDIISDLNEDAHNEVWDEWEQAEELDSEAHREDASISQAYVFRELLEDYPSLLEEAKHYTEQDEDFKMDWEAWYQPWLDEDDE